MGYKIAKELGLQVGDKVIFDKLSEDLYDSSLGEEAVLILDDYSFCPKFKLVSTGEEYYENLSDCTGRPLFTKVSIAIAPAISQPKLITHEEMKVGQKVKLISSGGKHPWWKFTVGEVYNVEKCYVDIGPVDYGGGIPSQNWDNWVWELVDEVSDNSASEQINLLQAKVDELTDALSVASNKLETLKEFVQNL